MKNINNILSIKMILFLCLSVIVFNACQADEEVFAKTRLFRPVLSEDLFAEGNVVIVNMGKLKEAIGYTLEVSRDTFKTIDYTINTEVSRVEINEELIGEELFWNTLYQVRATAHAQDPQYDSKVSDLGNVKTERFPTILNIPATFDVTDIAARVSWTVAGEAVTGIKVFAGDDLKLKTPLFPEKAVSSEEQLAGVSFVEGLSPETSYQIAIYSGTTLRGWVDYKTRVADIDPNGPGVIDIRADTSPSAIDNALATAPEGAIILVKRGMIYDMPTYALNKSVTIRAAYGFGEQKAKLYKDGNMNIASGTNIDHIRFIDLEIRGKNYAGNYVFNPSSGNTVINELTFDNCKIGTVRGVIRLRGTNALINTYEIKNSVVDSIGGYGLLTCDTNPGNPQTATVKNIKLTNSTFNKVTYLIVSRNNSESIAIEGCTFANVTNYFRYHGGANNDNVTNGISIKNSIFGHAWDETGAATTWTTVGIVNGLANTSFDVGNSYTTSDITWSKEVPNLTPKTYSKNQDDLWVDPQNNDFNFKDKSFVGRITAGDPRWRLKL
ncbi:protein of unknown function [Flavobacterium flevense]|uniref:DUF5123 domain-containing protein n=1 Tax=Flavobacterium flevense TaxID=983 RepID=A0A4Y4ASI4_9FLAO|nr:DUF5123 domain-containing protein [Flavobacterium flevense]GEC71201.1 hypothetical protein FFL01_07400 [Flavobacterium flevense]SHL31291.1 protein of unknown function [Flavobacterium flevense]